MANNILLVIGENGYGQLGLKTTNDALELVKWYDYNQDKYITSIDSGRFFTIFGDDRSQSYFSVGYNLSGQCGVGNNEYIIRSLKLIEYFKKNNIMIRRVVTSPCSYNTFYVTNKNKIYCVGPNRRNQLGLLDADNNNNNMDINEPILCKGLKSQCISIQGAYGYNLALCTNIKLMDYDILSYYCYKENLFRNMIPTEIINLIIVYCDINEVYSVGKCLFGANGHKQDVKIWTKIDFFDDKQITKIATGFNHSLFLDFTGNLFCCGRNDFGQLGLGYDKKLKDTVNERNELEEITFFSTKNIKIRSIATGWYHNLAIDFNDNIWCWGENSYGQCSDPNLSKNILCPQNIKLFHDKKIKIKAIQCGSNHSLIQTQDDKYYMFGDNEFNQCITYDNTMRITHPFCINQQIDKVTNGGKIKQISLGCGNTKIIVERP